MTALSRQYAATGDRRCGDRIAYIVAQLAECQDKYGDGYVGALPPRELACLRDLKSGKVDMSGTWVPWYTEHKVLGGLRDAWTLGGCPQAKPVALRLADWADEVTRGLTDDQVQTMLKMEQGGISEVLADIYALSGNPRHLEAARRFYHKAVMEPLLAGQDVLPGLHANTQIPKVVGQARIYEVTGDENGRRIAKFFWDRVANHHSWVIGGNSSSEYFFPEGDEAKHLTTYTAETCNTYNMLRLTRHLIGWEPKTEYADFYERALYNDILASTEPSRGMFTYFQSLKPGHFRIYSTETDSFWCCVGTGMENHTKYGDSIYFHDPDALYVNLYIPSRLDWREKGLTVEMTTRYPEDGAVRLVFTAKRPVTAGIKLRCPAWATGGLAVRVNGEAFPAVSTPGSYTEVRRTWKTGDTLDVAVPLTLRTEALPGAPNQRAFLYGPLVLAGDLGTAPNSGLPYAVRQGDLNLTTNIPSVVVPPVVTNAADIVSCVTRDAAAPGLAFRLDAGEGKTVVLRPYWQIFYNYYNVYWDVMTPEQFRARGSATETAPAN